MESSALMGGETTTSGESTWGNLTQPAKAHTDAGKGQVFHRADNPVLAAKVGCRSAEGLKRGVGKLHS